MSYDIKLIDASTKQVLQTHNPHNLRGGTYAVGGTTEANLNVTYNYSEHYRQHLDADQGIRWLYGQRAKDTFDRLEAAITALGTDRDTDYWKATPGNAGAALADLLTLGRMFPGGIWLGD